jgi:hypothetical protein
MEATRRRNAKIVALYSRGATKEMLGQRFLVTRERIRQIIAAARPRRPVAARSHPDRRVDMARLPGGLWGESGGQSDAVNTGKTDTGKRGLQGR